MYFSIIGVRLFYYSLWLFIGYKVLRCGIDVVIKIMKVKKNLMILYLGSCFKVYWIELRKCYI